MKKQLGSLKNMIGLTVRGAEKFDYSQAIAISFDDSFIVLMASQCRDDTPQIYVDCSRPPLSARLVRAGVCTQMELYKYEKKIERANAKSVRELELGMLKRLKEKYNE